jgi:hypothetical protein
MGGGGVEALRKKKEGRKIIKKCKKGFKKDTREEHKANK